MAIFDRFMKKNIKEVAPTAPIDGKTDANAQNTLSTSKSFYWGGTSSGVYVNEETAMKTAAVYSCVRVISEAIASLPLNIYEYEDGSHGEGQRVARDHGLYQLLHYEPNPDMTSFMWRETLTSHLLIYGNAYSQIIRDNSGNVKALHPLLPTKMDVWRSQQGDLFYTYWFDEDERHRVRRGEKPKTDEAYVTIPKEYVLHVSGLSFDGLVGYSPIALARNAIGLAVATEDYGSSFFANSANPAGILMSDKVLKNTDAIRAAWEALYKGNTKHHRLAVLEEGLKFQSVSVPPEEAQFLETRKFQLSEIARIFRVPPHMIGDLEKSSFNNIEQMSLEFLTYTLDPWVARFEQAMYQSLLLPSEKGRYFIKFNVDGLLRGDYATRMAGYAQGRQNGWLSANDIRRMENMNPVPAEMGGDEYFVNGNMLPMSVILEKSRRELAGNE